MTGKFSSPSAVRARWLAIVMFAAVLAACALLAAVFLAYPDGVLAEETEEISDCPPAVEDGVLPPDEDYEIWAESAAEARSEPSEHEEEEREHDEPECWQLCKVCTSESTQAYSLRDRVYAFGAPAKEDGVKRRSRPVCCRDSAAACGGMKGTMRQAVAPAGNKV